MEAFNEDKLVKYTMTDQVVLVGFPTFEDAQTYAAQKIGELVEVGFKDGNDNPQIVNEVGLVNRKLHFLVDAGSEYQFLHSSDPDFVKYSENLQEREADVKEKSLEEQYVTDAEVEIAEDPIIVVKNGQFESVTSRERSKYLKQAKVYEIGVRL